MTTPENCAQVFLESLHSEGTKSTFESLDQLIEGIENKLDPDPVELRLLENIYQFIEKLKILESNLNSYAINNMKSLPGNKLTDLYESNSSYGTSKLFE